MQNDYDVIARGIIQHVAHHTFKRFGHIFICLVPLLE